MAKQKASLHKGKVSGQTGEKHMQRDFDFERGDEHIDPCRTKLNVYKSFCPGSGSELEFYEERYRESLDLQNAKYEAKRNYKRIRTMQEVHECKKKRPTEEILQYSKNGGVEIPKATYDSIVESYISKLNEWSKQHGNHFHVLKYTTHYDEPIGMTHTHVRTIWDYEDENGVICIGQEEGMKQAGLEIPNPEKLKKDIARAEKHRDAANSYVTEFDEKTGRAISFSNKEEYDSEMKKYRSGVDNANRFNNRGITWTEIQREMWEDTLDEFGYECDRVRLPKAKHQSQKEWDKQMSQQMNELNAAKKEWQDLKDNQKKYIKEAGSEQAQKIYDEILAAAKEDALILAEKEIAKRKDEAEKEISFKRRQADNYAEEKQRESRQLEAKINQQKRLIEDNQPTIELIQNRENLLHQQDVKIQRNRQLMQQQAVELQAVQKGEEVEKKSGLDLKKYDNISKFADD